MKPHHSHVSTETLEDLKTWVDFHLPNCLEQLESLQAFPETFWNTRAKRLHRAFSVALATAKAKSTELSSLPATKPNTVTAVQRGLDTLIATIGLILAEADRISKTARSLDTFKSDFLPLRDMANAISELERGANDTALIMPFVDAIQKSPVQSLPIISTLTLHYEDSRDVLDMAASRFARWRKDAKTDRQRKQAADGLRLIKHHGGVLDVLERLLRQARILAELAVRAP